MGLDGMEEEEKLNKKRRSRNIRKGRRGSFLACFVFGVERESWLFDEGMGIGREGDVLRGHLNTIEKITPDVYLSSCSLARWRRRRWIILRFVLIAAIFDPTSNRLGIYNFWATYELSEVTCKYPLYEQA